MPIYPVGIQNDCSDGSVRESMEKGMDERKLTWEITEGYAIDQESGRILKREGYASSLRIYRARRGDRLVLQDGKCEYQIAFYDSCPDERYIYTYDYEPEENWTRYRGNLAWTAWKQTETVFEGNVYFRVTLRVREGLSEETVQDWNKVLLRIQTSEVNADGELCTENGRNFLYAEEIEKTVKSVKNAESENSLCYFLLSDSHYTVGGTWGGTIRNIGCVNEKLKADGCIHLGDLTDGIGSKEINSEYVRGIQRDFRDRGLNLYFTVGNHDFNYFRNNPECMTTSEMYAVYFGEGMDSAATAGKCRAVVPARKKDDARQGELWYHIDDAEHALRMIFLNSFDPTGKVRYGFSERELDWLELLLEEVPKEWHTVIFSHVPPVARLHYWSDEIRGSGRLTTLLRRYQRRSGNRLMGFIHGHNHADQIDLKEGFPIISIGCAKCEYFEDRKPEGAHTYYRELYTVSQELWDVLLINTDAEWLKFIRFGAGEDRIVYSGEKFGVFVWGEKTEDGRKEARIPMKKVITYGTFDLFHEGHYNLLKRAKALGDYLIVGVTTEHCDEQRGKINIVDSLMERIENVRKCGFADEIIIEDHEGQKIEDIRKYGVDIFTLGSDWRGTFDYLREYCEVVYLERTPDISSTLLRSAKFPIVRMGIVGTGRIAPRFLAEAKYVSGLNVQSAYNPHEENVRAFAEEYELEAYSGEFEEFLESVDAVYIATPHETHMEYTRKALQMHRHVLCEKPMAFTVRETEELFTLARENGVVLMEGIKTAYCPGFVQLLNIARSGRIGDIVDVEACFSRLTAPHLRERADAEYGGAFLEFGSYTVLPIVKLLGVQYQNVKFSSMLAENGVDLYTKVYFDYEKGMATSKTGVGVKSEGQLLISGTNGYILAESPWWLTRKFQVRYEDPGRIETYTPNFLGDGLRYEISEFVSEINGKNRHPDRMTKEESIAMADIVERFMAERREQRAERRRELLLQNRASSVRIWAHRGCSLRYPENTLAAFEAACRLPGISGIELDIQLSRDGEIVVFHDETLNRIVGRPERLQDFTWKELQQLKPDIPSMRQVLELVKPYAQKRGLQINIELKNSVLPYDGMEEKILSLVREYEMEDYVIYSSFNPGSLRKLKMAAPDVRVGILQSDIAECRRLAETLHAEALHPNVESVLREWEAGARKEIIPDRIVRAWNGQESFYGSDKPTVIFDLCRLQQAGVTDLITNVPENYLETV